MIGKRGARGGFTILELMLALALISVVAAVAIPAYFGRGHVTLENATILLARDLRAAQNRCAYLGVRADVEFFVDGDGYRVVGPKGEPIRNPRNDGTFVRRYSSDAVFEGVVIVHTSVGPDNKLSYDERGFAREAAAITLVFGGDTRTLRVDEKSGAITIVGSTSGWRDHGY